MRDFLWAIGFAGALVGSWALGTGLSFVAFSALLSLDLLSVKIGPPEDARPMDEFMGWVMAACWIVTVVPLARIYRRARHRDRRKSAAESLGHPESPADTAA